MKTRFGISDFKVPMTPDFVRCVGITKRFLKWHHCDYHVTSLQFTDQIQNDDQIWYFRF